MSAPSHNLTAAHIILAAMIAGGVFLALLLGLKPLLALILRAIY